MWAGLGYYRRARFLLEVSCARNGLMGKGLGRIYRKVGACLATITAAHSLFDVLPQRVWKINSEFHFPLNEGKEI